MPTSTLDGLKSRVAALNRRVPDLFWHNLLDFDPNDPFLTIESVSRSLNLP
jgi:hypothetical protein